MNNQIDPLQSIATALSTIFTSLGISHTTLGFPEPKQLEVDGYLPAIGILSVSDHGNHIVSRESIHSSVNSLDGLTSTVYREKLRIMFLLQISIFTATVEQRSELGWKILQYLVTHNQLTIGNLGVGTNGLPVETALFKYGHQHDDIGETGFYQKDLVFEVSARVLDAETAFVLTTPIVFNQTTE